MQMKDACWWGTKNSNQRRINVAKIDNHGDGAGTGITILFGGGGGRIR
jgi:hypothetical protein